MNEQPIEAFVGIDVAFAKKKRLPLCVCTQEDGQLRPFELKENKHILPPAGQGNKATLDEQIIEGYASEVAKHLERVQAAYGIKIVRIAIDAPSHYKAVGIDRRSAEVAMDKKGISCFATPSELEFEAIKQKVRKHLADGGSESQMPHANQLWMLVGFALFQELGKTYECLEVFPQAIVRALNVSQVHKSKSDGFSRQVEGISIRTGWDAVELEQKLEKIGHGSKHDKLDAFLSAWIASLSSEDRIACGTPPDDVIWIPK